MRVEPRWLDAASTADYINARVADLPRYVKQGRIPEPSYELGPRQPRWDRLALDRRFEGQAASADPEQVMAAVAQRILQQGR